MDKEALLAGIEDRKKPIIGETYQEIRDNYNKIINEMIDFIIENNSDSEDTEEDLECVGVSKEDFLLSATQIDNFDFLEDEQKRLGVTLPTSYVEFIKKEGILGFYDEYYLYGEDIYDNINTLDSLSNMYEFADEGTDVEKKRKEVTDKLIVFARGDESYQDCYYVCFNYHSFNPETNEADVFFFDQGDHPAMYECKNAPEAKESSMVQFTRGICKKKLELFYNFVDNYIDEYINIW